jgi:hypothetical protein
VSDLRGSGTQDIVALTNSSLSTLLGNGNTPVSVLLGNGDGAFAAPVGLNTGATSVASIVVGDFNGDGKPDIATSNNAASSSGTPSLSVLAGTGDGTFSAPVTTAIGATATALAAGSLEGGNLDLVLAGSNIVTVLPGNGNGAFTTTPTYPANLLYPDAIASGDFTGSGKSDLVVAGLGGNATVLLNGGNGAFHTGPTLTVNGTPSAVVVGDFNGDGKKDIAVGTQAGTIDVFLGSGNGTFGAAHVITLGSSYSIGAMAVGDFNHDGRADLAVTSALLNSQQSAVVTVLLNTGGGTFRMSANVTVGVIPSGLAVADYNGDNNLDLATTTFLADGSRNVKVLLGKGNGTFAAPITTTPGGSASYVAAGDFNGDSKQDLVLVDYFHHTVRVLPGNGNGSFGTPLMFLLNNPVGLMGAPVVGDFFGDHKLSVALTSGLASVSVLRGNGDGTFQSAVNYLAGFHGSQPSTLAVGDFNGDGKPDLAATDYVGGDVSVLINTSPAAITTTPIATTTSLIADAGTAVFGQTITVTATVASASGTPTGTVTFCDGGAVLGEVALDPNGHASLLVQLGVGVHSLKASFAGLGGFTASTGTLSETVNQAGTTTTVAAETFMGSQFAILSATITPVAPGAGVPTGTITFFVDGNIVGTAQLYGNGQASLAVYTLPRGKHTLTASYSGDTNFKASTSDVFVLNV